jgi:hypothetical protein
MFAFQCIRIQKNSVGDSLAKDVLDQIEKQDVTVSGGKSIHVWKNDVRCCQWIHTHTDAKHVLGVCLEGHKTKSVKRGL